MSVHVFAYCSGTESCVFRDKETHRCRILESPMHEDCNFRKTKKNYLRELKKYPPSNSDIEYIINKIISTGED